MSRAIMLDEDRTMIHRELDDDMHKRMERAIERRWGQSLAIDIIPTAMGNWKVIDRENGASLLVSTRCNRVRVIAEYPPRCW